MDISAWKDSLTLQKPPAMPALAEALWWEARGDWKRAHTIAQDVHSPEGAWVHAYLHRREGDQINAAYWYRQAHRPICREPLDAERETIVEASLSH